MFHGVPMGAIRHDGLPIGMGLQMGLGLSACPQELNSPTENTYSMLPRPGYELPEVPGSLGAFPHWTPSVDAEFSRLLALQSSGRLSSTTEADDNARPRPTATNPSSPGSPSSRRSSALQARRPSAVLQTLEGGAVPVPGRSGNAPGMSGNTPGPAPGNDHAAATANADEGGGESPVGRGFSEQIFEVLEGDTDGEDDDISSESDSIAPDAVTLVAPPELAASPASANPSPFGAAAAAAAVDAAAAATSAAIFERWIEQVLRENTPQKPAMPRATAQELASYTVTVQYQPSDEVEECCICLDSYEEGVALGLLPCCHKYHRSCVDRWLSQCRMCPICKRDIVH